MFVLAIYTLSLLSISFANDDLLFNCEDIDHQRVEQEWFKWIDGIEFAFTRNGSDIPTLTAAFDLLRPQMDTNFKLLARNCDGSIARHNSTGVDAFIEEEIHERSDEFPLVPGDMQTQFRYTPTRLVSGTNCDASTPVIVLQGKMEVNTRPLASGECVVLYERYFSTWKYTNGKWKITELDFNSCNPATLCAPGERRRHHIRGLDKEFRLI